MQTAAPRETAPSDARTTDFPGHFLLALDGDAIPAGWELRRVGQWHLGTHASVPVVQIGHDSARPAFLLGYAADADRAALVKSVGEWPPDLARWLESLGGRWLLVELTPGRERLYLDASGSFPVVYDHAARRAASTLSLLAEPPSIDPGSDVHTLVIEQKRFYPFGLTPHERVRRVLPNHTLDLTTWRAERSWVPAPGDDGQPAWRETTAARVPALVAQVTETMKATARALAAEGCLVGTITAGHDSRAVLACLRPVLDVTTFFTINGPSQVHRLDTQTGVDIARSVGVAHRVIPLKTADDAQMARYLYLVGYSAGGTILRAHPTGEGIGSTCFRLSGLGGEAARGHWWRLSDRAGTRFSAAELLDRMHIPVRDDFVAAGEEWLARLPQLDAFTLLDLAYVENLLGVWGSSQAVHAAAHSRAAVWLFSHRRVFEAIRHLPPAYRRGARLARDICRREWPELARFPVNRPPGLRPAVRELRDRVVVRIRGATD